MGPIARFGDTAGNALVLTLLLIWTGYPSRHPDVDLQPPGYNALGVIGIVAGLFMCSPALMLLRA